MGGAAAHLLVVVSVADDHGLVGVCVGEGVVATRAGWARFSLREALGQRREADVTPACHAPKDRCLRARMAQLGRW